MPNFEVSKPAKAPARRPSHDIFDALHDEMERVFMRFERGWPGLPAFFRGAHSGGGLVPELDIHENGEAVTIEADVPGVDEKDISVTLANGILTIKGEKKQEHEEKQENYYLSERSFGSFERSFRLPEGIDEAKVKASFDKGVLKITAAKKPEAVKAEKKIEIKTS